MPVYSITSKIINSNGANHWFLLETETSFEAISAAMKSGETIIGNKLEFSRLPGGKKALRGKTLIAVAGDEIATCQPAEIETDESEGEGVFEVQRVRRQNRRVPAEY